jgi:citrate lyase subunit beta/citryl-CoA lyase
MSTQVYRRTMRSLYGVPLDQSDKVDAAFAMGPDAVVLDLQAMVPASRKDVARENLASILDGEPAVTSWVRVAISDDEDDMAADLDASVRPGVVGLILPEAEHPDEIRALDERVTALERERGLPEGGLQLFPFPETALAIHRLYDILAASPRVSAVLFPSAPGGDLARDVGFKWTPEGTEILYMRQKIVVDARAAGVEHIFDGGWMLNIDDVEGFEADCRRSRAMGYTGRFAFNKAQAEAVNRAYSPSDDEVVQAQDVVDAWKAADVGDDVGLFEHNGKLIDITIVKHAEKVLAQAGRPVDTPSAG